MIRIIGYIFGVATTLGLFFCAAFFVYFMHIIKDLPDYEALARYEPPVITRFHAADGSLIGEFAHQKRLYLPLHSLPRRLQDAFLSAEDKNFYTHSGVDFLGLFRAIVINIRNFGAGRRALGASTITQQVAKNFLLTPDRTFERKIKELLLSFRIEKAYSKDRIFELYVNEIFFGQGAYGVASAALVYFDKPVNRLTLAESAYLACLPKAPANYHPFKHPERAIIRRNKILDHMLENGQVTIEESQKAKAEPLGVKPFRQNERLFHADYFTEEVRRQLVARYGERALYEGGLSVRTTLDPKMQTIAQKALQNAMIRYDRSQGYRGPKAHVNAAENWVQALSGMSFRDRLPQWHPAVVLRVSSSRMKIGLQSEKSLSYSPASGQAFATVEFSDLKWALKRIVAGKSVYAKSLEAVFKPGDVIYVEKKQDSSGQYVLQQFPQISGGMVAMDPHTGRVLAIVGGFSYSKSEFNRATQAMRQPGSAFKPIVYAAALDNGYTPASVIMDAPIAIQIGQTTWKPKNYDGGFAGPSTLRSGIERSRNLMTVRLAYHMGMKTVAEYAERFGVYDKLSPHIAMSLGAGETTVMRMVSAYAVMANGGRRIRPSFVDRIQDRYGKTIFRYDNRRCENCLVEKGDDYPEPVIVEHTEQVLDPMTAYQITSMMKGVVERGTATALRSLGRPLAGKTGTTNDERDVWFIGYTPNLVAGLYLGFDKPASLGRGVTGSSLAVPAFKEFIQESLRHTKSVEFRIPKGMTFLPINRKTGMNALLGEESIIEAFKPGTGPADFYEVIGTEDGMEVPEELSPEATRAVNEGSDLGLY